MSAMRVVHMSPGSLDQLVAHRRRTGAGHLDECWDGMWHLTDPSARHQQIAFRLCRIFAEVIEDTGRGTAWISINVTDRDENWIDNHRCPDGAVILKTNPGRWIGANQVAFLGGPDLVVEVSGDENDHDKLPFYGSLGVREILMIGQTQSRPELWRWEGGGYRRGDEPVTSVVTGLEFAQRPDGLVVTDAADRRWMV